MAVKLSSGNGALKVMKAGQFLSDGCKGLAALALAQAAQQRVVSESGSRVGDEFR